jgi:hypothetical protein
MESKAALATGPAKGWTRWLLRRPYALACEAARMTSWRNSLCVKIKKDLSLSGYVDTRIKGMAWLGRISIHAVFGGIAHSVSSAAAAGDHLTMAILRSTGFSLSRE